MVRPIRRAHHKQPGGYMTTIVMCLILIALILSLFAFIFQNAERIIYKLDDWFFSRRYRREQERQREIDDVDARIAAVITTNPQPPEPEILMEFSIAESGFKCLICNVIVEKDTAASPGGEPRSGEREIVRCSKCQTPAHKDCFEFNGKCGVFACGCKKHNKTRCYLCGLPMKQKDGIIDCFNKYCEHSL